MYRFWDSITKPLLECARPSTVVEIGSFDGAQTTSVFDFCNATGAKIHVIDPAPRFDIEKDLKAHTEVLVFHRALSVDALPVIGPMDVLLIDGDHNWYTVSNELRLIEEAAAKWGTPFPLCLFHDLGWPYARRDLYYDPSTIPEKYRHPFERKGIRPGQENVCESGGFNDHLCHAVKEGGPRNGVLTAIEDFLKTTKHELELISLPVLFGFSILVSTTMRRSNPDLDHKLTQLQVSIKELDPVLHAVEKDRVNALVLLHETQQKLRAQKTSGNVAPVEPKLDSAPSYEQILASKRWKLANTLANSINKVVGRVMRK